MVVVPIVVTTGDKESGFDFGEGDWRMASIIAQFPQLLKFILHT